MLNCEFEYDEEGTIPTENDYRKIFLMTNPKLWGTNTYADGDVYDCTWHLQLSGIENIETDTVLEGVDSGAKGVVVKIDSLSNTVWLSEIQGTFSESETIRIKNTEIIFQIQEMSPPAIQPRSGNIILKEYRSRVARADDQSEFVAICIEF
jgi:hypothetical protein